MWLFRVASRPLAGSGHVSRCLNIARVFGSAQVCFALDADGSHWHQVLKQEGIKTVAPEETYANHWQGILYDRHLADQSEAEALRLVTRRLVIIADDEEPPACADLFINYMTDLSDREVNGVPALLGARYAPVDTTPFSLPRDVANEATSILVSFGGVDSGNATCLVLAGLRHATTSRWQPQITVAIGSKAVHLSRVETFAETLAGDCTVLIDAPNMPELLATADLAIGAGGLSMFERLAAGAPSITIETAPHQRKATVAAAAARATINLGPLADLACNRFQEALSPTVKSTSVRAALSKAGQRYVDGKGTERIVKALKSGH